MNKKVLIIGYGSAGKRHARNLMHLGIKPVIVTRHPDTLKTRFTRNIKALMADRFDACIISSATADHYDDFRDCLRYCEGIKNILIEKPLESSYNKAEGIARAAGKRNIYIGYNLRFLKAFDLIAKFIKKNKKSIRMVEAVAGEDLRLWRPKRNMAKSYSAYRSRGGGVDLDLSHEVDYILWLFGNNFKDKFIYRNKISNLRINSPDICKLILEYGSFLAGITLDYIRPQKERYLNVSCDNGSSLFFDFVTGILKINNKVAFKSKEINESYIKMMRAFLGRDKQAKKKLCTIKEAKAVLKALGV